MTRKMLCLHITIIIGVLKVEHIVYAHPPHLYPHTPALNKQPDDTTLLKASLEAYSRDHPITFIKIVPLEAMLVSDVSAPAKIDTVTYLRLWHVLNIQSCHQCCNKLPELRAKPPPTRGGVFLFTDFWCVGDKCRSGSEIWYQDIFAIFLCHVERIALLDEISTIDRIDFKFFLFGAVDRVRIGKLEVAVFGLALHSACEAVRHIRTYLCP